MISSAVRAVDYVGAAEKPGLRHDGLRHDPQVAEPATMLDEIRDLPALVRRAANHQHGSMRISMTRLSFCAPARSFTSGGRCLRPRNIRIRASGATVSDLCLAASTQSGKVPILPEFGSHRGQSRINP
jgi:hypothetical protein